MKSEKSYQGVKKSTKVGRIKVKQSYMGIKRAWR